MNVGIAGGGNNNGPLQKSAEELFKQGFTFLDRVFNSKQLEKVRNYIKKQFPEYCSIVAAEQCTVATRVGNGRYIFNLPLRGPLSDSELFANPKILDVLKSELVLGPDFVIEAFGLVNSFPGAKPQHPHRDGLTLFGGPLVRLLPTHAVTVAIPLVDMDDRNGMTAFWPNSHRHEEVNPSDDMWSAQPVRIGSCGIWDFRTYHRGLANRSRNTRPLIFITYARSWFRDVPNYKKNKDLLRLNFDKDFVDSLTDDNLRLFSHVLCENGFRPS